jgi:hypothetical protein
MSRAATLLLAGALALALLVGLLMARRLDAPAKGAWWRGKDVAVRVQVWEPGRDMPTVSMTFPKKTLDRMVALGFPSEISVGRGQLEFKSFWHDLQRLPRGEKMRFEEDGSTVLIWVEERGKAGAQPDEAPQALPDSGT